MKVPTSILSETERFEIVAWFLFTKEDVRICSTAELLTPKIPTDFKSKATDAQKGAYNS